MTQPVGHRNPRTMLDVDQANGATLREAKQKHTHSASTTAAHAAADALAHGLELGAESLPAAPGLGAALVAPAASMILNTVMVHSDWKAGQEIGAARERDIKNTAALLLAQESLGPAYVQAELARLQHAYDSGTRIDRDAWAVSVERLVTAVAAEAGGFAQAHAMFDAAAEAGKAAAARLHLTNQPQIRLQCASDPDFRHRFETDPAFRHGVEAYAASTPSATMTGKQKATHVAP